MSYTQKPFTLIIRKHQLAMDFLFKKQSSVPTARSPQIASQVVADHAKFIADANAAGHKVTDTTGIISTKVRDANELTWENGEAEIERLYYVDFDFSLNEAAAKNNTKTTWTITKADWNMFQKKKDLEIESDADYESERVGDLDKAILREIEIVKVSSNCGQALSLQIGDGKSRVKGRMYGKRKVRAPYIIFPYEDGRPVQDAVVHKLPENLAKMADRRFTRVTEEYLDEQWQPLPKVSDYVALNVDSLITDCLQRNETTLGIDLMAMPTMAMGQCYVLETELLELCKKTLLDARANISLPFTDLYKLQVRLQPASGKDWANIDTVNSIAADTGEQGTALLDKRNQVHVLMRVKFTIGSGPGWK